MSNFSDIIMGRKSVRTYDGKGLSKEHINKIEEYIKTIDNPFNIPVDFRVLDAKEYGLSSPVLTGEDMYVAAKVKTCPNAEVAYGYSFEKLVLYAWSLGIGTVWIGGTMKREVFESAVELNDGELMPCVSPIGYPAEKKSIKEVMMRKGVGADSRIASKKLFFDEEWSNPYTPDEDVAEVLEMVRWAPSAVNKQPWRIIHKKGVYHFYEKKDPGFVREGTGDLQKIDVGIALCHFITGLEEKGKQVDVMVEDPKINVPENVEYIVSVTIK